MTRRILVVLTNVDRYPGSDHRTGLWLSELTHAWEVFEQAGFEQTLLSPRGGAVPLEPRSLKFPNLDATGTAWLADPARMALLQNTASPDQVDPGEYDAIFFTGGHAVMDDFTDDPGLQALTRQLYEAGRVVASVCHGYCALLDTRLSDGSYLIAGKQMTGFAWSEEVLARVDKLVPYNAEQRAKDRGAVYRKARLPFVSHVVADGNLITGQNPGSAKATALRVAAALR